MITIEVTGWCIALLLYRQRGNEGLFEYEVTEKNYGIPDGSESSDLRLIETVQRTKLIYKRLFDGILEFILSFQGFQRRTVPVQYIIFGLYVWHRMHKST